MDRRRFLKAVGVAIPLPLLRSLSFAGQAPGKEPGKPVKRFVSVSNNYGIYAKAFFPDQAGKDYVLPSTLQPMDRHRKEFTVFSNLDHGLSGGHACVPSLLSGLNPNMADNFPEGNISVDQKMAEFLGATTRFPSMTLGVKEKNQTSYTRSGVQVPSIGLIQMYRGLFLEDSPRARREEVLRLKRNRSILDVVMGKARAVNGRLGKQDQRKFEEYLDSVRSLERKIVQQETWLDRPKPGAPFKEPMQTNKIEADLKTTMELIALALKTDSSRVINLACGIGNGDFTVKGGYHGYSHHNEKEEKVKILKLIDAHKFEAIAHLIDLLKSTPDPLNEGGSLFDHTMILHGCGMATGTHSTRNLPLALAGGGFKLGEHLALPAGKGKRILASNLLLSILQNFGLEVDRFANSSGTLRGREIG